MDKQTAITITGGLSKPSKMPGHGYSIPAVACQTGSKLAQREGTVCSGCYAMRGRYQFPNVQAAMRRRLDAIADPAWPTAMALLIAQSGDQHFRWHDSGDLQSPAHLAAIVDVARQTPHVQHWLPTREWGHVRAFLQAGGTFPPNLTVRYSLPMVDTPAASADAWARNAGIPVSTVHSTGNAPAEAHVCPARHQGNACGECRACWDPTVRHVSYPKH